MIGLGISNFGVVDYWAVVYKFVPWRLFEEMGVWRVSLDAIVSLVVARVDSVRHVIILQIWFPIPIPWRFIVIIQVRSQG